MPIFFSPFKCSILVTRHWIRQLQRKNKEKYRSRENRGKKYTAAVSAMADADPHLRRLLLPAEETVFELLLRFGLYIGAAFQAACLLAIVAYQSGPSDGVAMLKDDPSDVECSENSPQVTPRRPHRPRKQEKKKRR